MKYFGTIEESKTEEGKRLLILTMTHKAMRNVALCMLEHLIDSDHCPEMITIDLEDGSLLQIDMDH